MEVEFTNHFIKDLKNIDDKKLLNRVKKVILTIEKSGKISEISNIKFIKNSESYMRVKLGDYRIGIKLGAQKVKIIRFLHRKDIYKYFP